MATPVLAQEQTATTATGKWYAAEMQHGSNVVVRVMDTAPDGTWSPSRLEALDRLKVRYLDSLQHHERGVRTAKAALFAIEAERGR